MTEVTVEMRREHDLDNLLAFIEENIDLHHIQRVEELHTKTLSYEKVPFLPLTVIPKIDSRDLYPYVEAYSDPAKMMYNELMQSFGSIYASVQLKDFYPLHIRSNYGIGILASAFGAECIVLENNMPWVNPIGLEGARAIVDKSPDIYSGLTRRVIETNQYYLDKLHDYPKAAQTIKVTQPDMQGPFDIAHLLLGSEIFYLVYDEPKLLYDLLSLITDAYIEFRTKLQSYITDQIGDAIYIHGGIYSGKILLKEDTAFINLSPEMYERFALPFNTRILEEFNGSMHYCGPVQQWHYEALASQRIRSINYGNPELQDIEQVLAINKRDKRPIIGWGYNQDFSFLEETWQSKPETGITLACSVDDIETGKRTLETYLEKSNK